MNKEYNKLFNIKSKEILVLLCVCFVQILISGFSWVKGNIVYDICSVISMIAIAFLIYLYQPEIFLKYLWFVIISIWGIVSVFILENGAVVLRGKSSFHYGSLPTYCLGWCVFWATIIIKELRYKIKYMKDDTIKNFDEFNPSDTTMKNIKILAYIAIAWMIICFISIVNKPYFIYGIDRFQYAREFMPQLVSKSMIFLYTLIPIILMIRKKEKKITYIYCGIFTLLNIWCGEKFSGLIILFYFIILAISPVCISEKMIYKTKKTIKIIALALVFLIGIVILQQLVLGLKTSELLEYFQKRIAAQGELWWLMYRGDATGGTHFNEMMDEISILVNQPNGQMSEYNFGIYKLMKLFMNSDWVKYALSRGIRATESTRASFFYYGKIPGLIIGQVLLALLVSFIVNKIIVNCNKRRIVSACGCMYIFKYVITASIMSDFQLLTTKKIILVYIVMAVLGIRGKNNREQKNE